MRLLTLTAVLALVAAPALAASERGAMRGMMPAFDFQAADADGDGVLTRAEFAAHAEAQIAAARDAMFDRQAAAIMDAGDADGDGTLTAEELRAGLAVVHAERMERRASWRERHAERRAERGEARSERWGDRAGRGHMSRRAMHGMMDEDRRAAMIDRMFDRIDADGDGTISAEEFAAAEARWQAGRERRGQRRGD